MKLILIPLSIMLLIGILSMSGLGTGMDYHDSMQYYTGVDDLGNKAVLYNSAGVGICYYDGNSSTASVGSVILYEADGNPPQECAWYNGTYYQLYYDTSGEQPVYWMDRTPIGMFARPTDRIDTGTWTWAGSMGVISLVGVLMFIGSFVGLRIFGSGEGEVSLSFILKGTFFITLWLALTVFTFPMFYDSGVSVMLIIYLVLTVMYSIGIINQVGSPQDD